MRTCEDRASCRVDKRSKLNRTRVVDVGDEPLLSPVSESGISLERLFGLVGGLTIARKCSEVKRFAFASR